MMNSVVFLVHAQCTPATQGTHKGHMRCCLSLMQHNGGWLYLGLVI